MTSYQGLQLDIPTVDDISYAAYVAQLEPLLWYPMNEPSGTTVINYGSLGSGNGTFTPGAGAVNQVGKLGAGEAYDFDGADSRIAGPTTTSINNLTAFTYVLLVKADSAGEANAGYLWADTGGNRIFNISAGTGPVRFTLTVWGSGNFSQVTQDVASAVPLATWVLLFCTFDNAGDRTPSIFVGRNGAVAESTYSTEIALAVALANASGALNVGNISSSIRTWDGLIDEFIIFNRVLTAQEMLALTVAAGV